VKAQFSQLHLATVVIRLALEGEQVLELTP
jgi:hypothetical protein